MHENNRRRTRAGSVVNLLLRRVRCSWDTLGDALRGGAVVCQPGGTGREAVEPLAFQSLLLLHVVCALLLAGEDLLLVLGVLQDTGDMGRANTPDTLRGEEEVLDIRVRCEGSVTSFRRFGCTRGPLP